MQNVLLSRRVPTDQEVLGLDIAVDQVFAVHKLHPSDLQLQIYS